jgi:hypothetical protein
MTSIETITTTISVLSLFIAIYQTFKAQKIKKIQRNHCESRCKNIVKLTRKMLEEVVGACSSINEEMVELSLSGKKPNINIQNTAMKINGINVLTQLLISYCSEINDEHMNIFGYKVFSDIEKELPDKECLFTVKNRLEHTLKNK